jgi:hypothetical protein
MKLTSHSKRLRLFGFTLAEAQIAMAVFALMMAGVLTGHLYGLRMNQVTRCKLGASDEARKAIGKLFEEIRTAKYVRVGTGTLNTFLEITNLNIVQQGNALRITPGTNTDFIQYYWDSADKKLKRTTTGASAALVVANSISNSMVFTLEDFQGKPLTNTQNNFVVGLKLEFYQLDFPDVAIGPGQLFDYYQLRTKVTKRLYGH